jgi:hypothetical protein
MVDRGQFPAVSAGRLRRRVLHDGPHVSLMIVGYAGGDWHTHIDDRPVLQERRDTVHSAEKRFNLEVLGDFWVRGSTGHIAGAIPHWISSGTGLAAQTLDALLICRSFNDGDQTPRYHRRRCQSLLHGDRQRHPRAT